MRPASLVALLGLVAGCAPGTSTLALTITSETVVDGVDRLRLVFTDVDRTKTSTPVELSVGGASIPPPQRFSFQFPPQTDGVLHIEATALDAAGGTLSAGTLDVNITPSKSASATLTLGAGVVPDGGADMPPALPPDPMLSTVVVDRAADVVADDTDAARVTVTLRDADGAPIAGALVSLSASGTGGRFSMPPPTDADGVTTASLSSTVAETKTVTAVATGVTLTQMPTVAFIAGAAARLLFSTQPASGLVQRPLAPFKVVVQDARGNPVPSATNALTVAIENNPGGANLTGDSAATAKAGEATFDLVALDKAGTGYTLTVSGTGLASVTSAAFNVAAVAYQPVSTGLYGGRIVTLAISPPMGGGNPTVWAGTHVGAFKSTNLGGTWTNASFGLFGGAGTLVADPVSPTTVYALSQIVGGGGFGNDFPGIKRTSNGGVFWRSAGTLNSPVGLAIDPMNPNILYTGGDGAYKSTDGGTTWTKTTHPYDCIRIAVDPVTTSTVYCAAYDRANSMFKGIYKSPDSGATWAPVNTGLPATPNVDFIVATPNAVLADVNNTLYRSTNGGGNWTATAITFPRWAAYAPTAPATVYLARGGTGVAISSDSGATFGTAVSTGGSVANYVAVDPTNVSRAFAGTDIGVFITTDGGTTWNPVSTGITALSVRAVAMRPSAPNTIFAGGPESIYRSIDGGASWTTKVISQEVNSLAIDPANTNNVYACSLGSSFFATTDGGANWGTGVDTAGAGYCYNIDIHGATIYVSTVGGGVRKSVNSGAVWAAVGQANPTYAVLADDATTIVANTNAGVFRTINSGTNWTKTGDVLGNALLRDPVTATTIVAGLSCGSAGPLSSQGGFITSTDGGASWGGVSAMGFCVSSLFTNGTNFYASGRGGFQVAISTDKVFWRGTGPGIPPGLESYAVVASADGQTLYVATQAGLYKSTTGGF